MIIQLSNAQNAEKSSKMKIDFNITRNMFAKNTNHVMYAKLFTQLAMHINAMKSFVGFVFKAMVRRTSIVGIQVKVV